MSRQIRRQIPQKQKKKRVDRNACLLVFILIFSGILTFLLLTARDNSKLNSTLDETFDFVKNRIESYEIYNTNDQVKSLVRLLDKTTELSRVIEQEGNLSTEMLDEYAREQRLTGILVLDQNLKVTEQSAKDGDTMSLWQKLIKSDYVRDIAEHPEKTYTTRLRNKGKIYDFAAVARQDAAGILIIYAQKEEVNELNGDLTMASLFSDFPFEMNGSVVICDDDKVVSTNRQELTARSIEEAKSQYKNKFEADENGVVHLRSETGNWFGRREKIKDYDAYIFFPESQVYITRNIICVIYVLLALLLFLLYRVNRSRTEKRSILQDQKRLRVINALGHAYASISLVNLKTEEIEILKSSGNMKPDQKGDMLFKAHQEELIRQVIAEPFQKAYWEFVDISTVAKRMEERETLSFTARTVDERWMTMIIVPQGYDKDGKLCTVLVAIRDATEEKGFHFLHLAVTILSLQLCVLYIHRNTCRNAPSSMGRTSWRSRTKIRYIFAVQLPIPRIFVKIATTSSSDKRFSASKSSVPFVIAFVIFRMYSTFALDIPVPLICSSVSAQIRSGDISSPQSFSSRLYIFCPALTESICSIIS